MLSFLRIRGLALLDDVSLELAPGLNVLTGETGAGKSIIVDALSILRGARARADLVREGEEAAIVDAQFDLADGGDVLSGLFAEHGLPDLSEEGLVLRRIVPRTGRGRSFVQSELITRGLLTQITERLVDICSQHEHHSLTRVPRHLDLLDAYARIEGEQDQYAVAYRAWREARDAREDLERRADEGVSRADYLRFQLEELERIDPRPGEYEQLKPRIALLREAHTWAEFAHRVQHELYESDDAMSGRLAALADRARRGSGDSPHLTALAEHLTTAEAACDEAAQVATRLLEDLELEPHELEEVEERMHELELLRRKHGMDLDDLGVRMGKMREELNSIEHASEHLAALRSREGELRDAAVQMAESLRRRRRKAARGLGRAVESELAALHMPHARMEARLEALPPEELGPRGLDRVEFLFSANEGEKTSALTRVASGGELSRVLLAVKGVLATGDRVATYVFDEVDAGVGGAVAESIGRRLRGAAGGHQVVCITHLPQIAAFADAHFRVEKKHQAGRTLTRVARLDQESRLEEIARMLGGSRITDSAREHARALVAEAGRKMKRSTKKTGKKTRPTVSRRARR